MKKLILISSFLIALCDTIYAQEVFDAIKANDLNKVKTLVEKDPQLLKIKDSSGRTPLIWAARGVYLDILKYLIENGGDVNVKDANGTTPLHSTALRGHIEASKLLIEKGAIVNDKNNSGATPFYYAATTGNKELLNFLLLSGANKSDIEIRNAYGRTPLCAVSRDGGNAEVIKVLIDLGADVNAVDASGNSPILLAAWRPNKDAVNLLLDAGADLQIGTPKGEQILADAANYGLERLFNVMVRKNAPLNILNEDGGTLLHSASGGGSLKIVESLISMGFDVNKKDKYGWYPVHIAAEQGHKEILTLLIKNGADINARNMLGETPYNIAQDRQDSLLISYLKSIGSDTSAPKFPKIKGKYLGRHLPDLNPEEFAPGIVSHRYRPHSTVAVSPNGDEIFWNPMIISRGGGYSYGYIMTTKLENGIWTHPEKAFFSEKDYNDDHPFFTANGKRLYFLSSNRSGFGNSPKLWYVEKTKNGWSEPKFMDKLQFPSGSNQLFTTFSLDEKGNFYFGNGDIYFSQFSNGEYSPFEKIEGNINTDALEGSPLISPKGDYLLFNRGTGNEKQILVCFRKSNHTWSEPINISEQIGKHSLNLSISGNFLMLGGQRWVSTKIIEELKPKDL